MNEKIAKLTDKVIIESGLGLYELVPRGQEHIENFEYHDVNNKKAAIKLSDEEVNRLLMLNLVERVKAQDKKLKTIRGIMVFWFTIDILNLLFFAWLFIMANK